MEKTLKNIYFNIDNVLNQMRAFACVADQLEQSLRDMDQLLSAGNRLQLDALLIRKVAAQLATSGDLNTACKTVANETGLSFDCVYFAFTHAKSIKKVLTRYALAYACQRLKKRGLKAKQICDLLDISEQYFYKLQKKADDDLTGKDLLKSL